MAAVGLPPVTAALVNVIVAFVLFVSVTVCGALVVPIGTGPKFRLVGAQTNVGMSVSLATKASLGPFRVVRCGSDVVGVAGKTGKFAVEKVCPEM